MVINTFAVCALEDNYIWVMQCADNIIVVDPGEYEPCVAFLKAHDLTPTHILITHHHDDHTGGLLELAQRYPQALVYGPKLTNQPTNYHVLAQDNSLITMSGCTWQSFHSPGHTLDHLCYYLDDGPGYLFCGDTLFSAGCGRAFEGDAAMLYTSLSRINALKASTVMYPAHEYTESNLAFAKMLEPDNEDIARYTLDVAKKRRNNEPSLPSHLALERKVNPFLRVHEPALAARVAQLSALPSNDPVQVFTALRTLKDRF